MTRRWIYGVGIAIATACAAVACGKCGDAAKVEDAAAVAVEPPVPAPDKLLADVYVPSPNVAWSKLQRGIGGAVGILPATAGGVVCTALGLDPALASDVDGTSPLYAVLAGDPASPSWTIALKLSDVRKARGILLDGEMARFAAREAPGMTELVAKPGAPSPHAAIAITNSSFLVFGNSSADLERLTPYVTRTLPSRPLPVVEGGGALIADVPHSAIAVTIKPKLDELWSLAKDYLLASDARARAEHGGRAPDYGDPKAIVKALDAFATKRLAVVGDLETMRIAVDVTDDGISLAATMTPMPDAAGAATKWLAAMKTGDTTPASSFPATSAVVLSTRDGDEDRAEQGKELEAAVTSVLGARLGEADTKRLHDTIEDWTKARGDTTAAALAWEEPQGLVLRTAARDADAAGRAMKGVVDLVRVAPFKEMLRVRDVTMSTEDLGPAGKASLALVAREPAKADPKLADRRPRPAAADAGAGKPAKKDELAVAWVVEGGALSVATGPDAPASLRGHVKPEKKLADEPAIARPLRGLANDASFVLVAQPLKLDPARANLPPAPIVVGLGKREQKGFFRMTVANGLLRELARWQLGL